MRPVSLIVLSLVIAVCGVALPATAAQPGHLILDPQHALTADDVAALAAQGVDVLRPLSGGRYLVRVTPGSAIDETDVRVRSLQAIAPDTKLQRSAERMLARSLAPVALNVFFHDDVPLDAARATVLAAGGTLADPLETSMSEPKRLRAWIEPQAAQKLAADDRVLMIRAPFRLRPESHNATTALVGKVTPLYSAPYGLTGKDVVLSFFELATPFQHSDFQGRLTVNWTCPASDPDCTQNFKTHATHVAGTIIGSGAGNAQAKGMAPSATLHSFDAGRDAAAYLADKSKALRPVGVIADNNSWGYIIGWFEGGPQGWTWEDTEEYFGGYDGEVTAPLDKITRDTGVLFVHSSGNDGDKFGPTRPPFAHSHIDDDFNPLPNRVFCYSSDGSGNDCASPCTAGDCEVIRHPVNAPFRSMGVTAAAKNILTVGGTNAAPLIGNYSSRGPTADGRIKPDLVARGGTDAGPVFSTGPNNGYVSTSGTSMAAPAVTGMVGLLTEQWRRLAGSDPSPTLLKTALLVTADDLGVPGPDYTYGFGFANAKAAVDLLRADANAGRRFRSANITHGARVEIPIAVNATQDLRVMVSWPDPDVLLFDEETDLAAVALVNDLDLKIIDPLGADVLPYVLDKNSPTSPATRGVNTVDNTELVEIRNALAGTYTAVLTAKINDSRAAEQPYVLVANADVGVSAAPCVDVHEPNETMETAYGLLTNNSPLAARICTAGDVDFYRFRADTSGLVRITVTAGDVPLRVSIAGATTPTVDVAAGETKSIEFTYATGISPVPSIVFVVKVEPIGGIIGDTRYTLTPTFPTLRTPRRRIVRR